jgi:hypothetical protein
MTVSEAWAKQWQLKHPFWLPSLALSRPQWIASTCTALPPHASCCHFLPQIFGLSYPLGCRLPTLDSRDGNRQPSVVWRRLPTGDFHCFHCFNGGWCVSDPSRGRKFSKFAGGMYTQQARWKKHLLVGRHLFPSPACLHMNQYCQTKPRAWPTKPWPMPSVSLKTERQQEMNITFG